MIKKRIFISGGAGVIGSELVKILEKQNCIIFVGDLKKKPSDFSNHIAYYQGDLNYINKDLITDFKPEIFIHLAASFERSEESYDFWEENFHNNVNLSHHLMTIMKDISSLKRVVFASSYLIYDPSLYLSKKFTNKDSSLQESDSLNPRNLTGMAKFSHENELRFIEKNNGKKISCISIRIFRGYGKNSRDIISRWIRLLIKGKNIEVFRPEGKFDFIYAKDTAEGILRVTKDYSIKGSLNLGTGKSRSIFDIIEILSKHFDKIKIINKNQNIPYESSQANMHLFQKLVKWKPQYDLEKAIPEIISYEKRKISKIESDKEYNILITSSSKKVSLVKSCITGAKKINSDIKVISGDSNINSISKFITKVFWKMPKTNDTNLKLILNECIKRKIKLVIPTRDQELLFWSKNIKKFHENGITVSISPQKTIVACNDKYLFSKIGIKNNIPIINSSLNISDIDSQFFVVKERYGSGSKEIGIKLKRNQAIKFSKKLDEPIFQPYYEGKEISIDAWFDKKSFLIGMSLRERSLIRNGESQITKTFQNKLIQNNMKKIFKYFKFCGPIVFQAIVIKDKIFIIECNPRFGGASTASVHIGLDIFYWTILESLGTSSKEFSFIRKKNELTQIRVPHDIHKYDTNI